MMVKRSDWANETIMEAPYWKDGMSPEEYDREREYYLKNYNLVREGKYKPLWKQRMEEGHS